MSQDGQASASEQQLNEQVMDAFIELIRRLPAMGQRISAQFGLLGSDAMALSKLDCPVSMKGLAEKLGCDASFITSIANHLEKLGMALRESDPADRRVKLITLTERGSSVREQLMSEISQRMPWGTVLDQDERHCLLTLLRKMNTVPLERLHDEPCQASPAEPGR